MGKALEGHIVRDQTLMSTHNTVSGLPDMAVAMSSPSLDEEVLQWNKMHNEMGLRRETATTAGSA